MNKVFISRSEGNIPWGFRLQGGLEDNEPLTLTNVSVHVRVPISKTTDIKLSINRSIEMRREILSAINIDIHC